MTSNVQQNIKTNSSNARNNILAKLKQQVKGSDWFDHIFFFINRSENSVLKTSYNFTAEYLSYIKSLNVVSTIKICSSVIRILLPIMTFLSLILYHNRL